MTQRVATCLSALLLAGLSACASSDGSAVASDVAAVRSGAELPDGGGTPRAAVILTPPNVARAVAFPSRFPRLLDAIGLGGKGPKPERDDDLRCREERVISLFAADAGDLAEVDALCRGLDPRIGLLRLANGNQYRLTIDPAALEALATEPMLVGDALFGMTSVEVIHPNDPETEAVGTRAPELVLATVAALGPPQALRPTAPPSCAGSTVVTLSFHANVRATIAICEERDPKRARATVSTSDPSVGGTIAVDLAELTRLEAQMR